MITGRRRGPPEAYGAGSTEVVACGGGPAGWGGGFFIFTESLLTRRGGGLGPCSWRRGEELLVGSISQRERDRWMRV